MPFAGNLGTLPLPDVFQTLNNIKATGVLRLRAQPGARDVVFQNGEIVGVGFLDAQGREDFDARRTHLGVDPDAASRHKTGTWFINAMQARKRASGDELRELVRQQALDQLGNLFAWNHADFAFEDATPGSAAAQLLAICHEHPLAIDTATVLLEAARQQDEWAELRARIRDETGAAAAQSSPQLSPVPDDDQPLYHLYVDGEWKGPFPRTTVIGMVQTGAVATETWSYDARTQARETLDKALGSQARRITPQDLDALRQAVHAAENRVADERAAHEAVLAELRGLAGEVLRLARELDAQDPALAAVIGRLAEVLGGHDPSLIVLASETVLVSLVRHLAADAIEAREGAAADHARLTARVQALEHDGEAQRQELERQLAEAERRQEREHATAENLRHLLAQAAEDAARLDEQLERVRRESQDASRVSTARLNALRSPEDIARAQADRSGREQVRILDLERELARSRAEHARMLGEVATLQTRLDEADARREAEVDAARAIGASLAGPAPAADAGVVARLEAKIARLSAALAETQERAGHGSDQRKAVAQERDQAREETERLRRDLSRARAAEARVRELEAHIATLTSERDRIAAEKTQHERSAYELSRQNTQQNLRLRELANQLAAGERRLAELSGLAGQLQAAKQEAGSLSFQSRRIHADLARLREQASGKLERAQRRIAHLRQRLHDARAEARRAREASAIRSGLDIALPPPASVSSLPVQMQAPTGSFMPGGTGALVHTGSLASHPLHPPTAVTRRLPQPEDSAQPDQGGLGSRATALLPRTHNPWPRRLAYTGLGALLMLPVLVAVAAATAPISSQAQVQAREVPVTAPIAGQVHIETQRQVGSHGLVARLVNHEIDDTRLVRLRDQQVQNQERLGSLEVSLAKAQAEHARLVRELADEPTPGPERTLLKDLHAMRIVELQGQVDDLRRRREQLADDTGAEEVRVAALRQATITSPVAGTIRNPTTKNTVEVGEVVCTVVDQDSVVIEALFSDSWRDRVRPGTLARVQIGSVGFDASVRELADQAPPGCIRVRLDVNEQMRPTLVPNSPATVALTGASGGPLTRLGIWLRF